MTSRWDQFDNQFTSLRDAMGRLLDQSFTLGNRGEGGGESTQNATSIPVNIFEAEDIIMVIAPMPGLQDEDIDITVRGNSLTIEGRERADLKPGSGKRYLRHEWRYGPYRRMIELPYAVDANSAEATLGNGVLTVRLSKAETERVRRIQVRGGASGSVGEGEGARAGLHGQSAPTYGGESRSDGDGQTIKPIEGVRHQEPGQSEQR
jgi:HSP20 family protein